ncbi:MAG: cadmium-translocating P-type ATPase [Oscillospiraceae bacterium]|nr:cadmium-translocating P-type ATPase [Oscillospiraceae bacterium]
MVRKRYVIENLDCANCAAKIESKFNAHEKVQEAVITFSTKQLRLTAEDPDALIPELVRIARTVEGNVEIYLKEKAEKHTHAEHHGHHHEEDHECGCGHHHEEDHECGCGHHHEEGHECGCGHHHEEGHECGCGHHHEEGHECGCGHHHEEGHECGCGHHHEHDQECECGHHHDHHEGQDKEKRELVLGVLAFGAALLVQALGFGIGALLGFVFAYWILGREVLKTAARNLTKGHVMDENFLMSLATIGAFFIGEFPEAAGVMLFYRVGEYFEHRAVERSRSQIMEAVDLRPEVVQLLDGEEVREIPAEEARVGDRLLVRPGDRIPLDGIVLDGESRIDTAPITGEPVPVRVKVGDSVTSGCVNTVGQLTIRVEKPLSESMVTRILDSVENAAASKPKFEKFITRFARIYTPVVVGIAAATALIPSLITGDWGYWVYTALNFLVMSCPCALVLSVPLAFFAGIGAGSKKGILFKGGQSMEALAKVKAVVMDKTGTLTKGDFKVQSIVGGMPLLQLCASCEQTSTHPIAASIVAAAKEQKLELMQPEKLLELPGKGIHAILQGNDILCGNAKLLQERGIVFAEMKDPGSVVYVSVNGLYQGCLIINDSLKAGAEVAVRQLRDKGIETVMLTGDAERSAKAVAGLVGIREVHAGLLPQQKLEHLQAIRQEKGAVMFVGDGINDAPVLAGADVGAAMGSGADAAIEAADVVFMTSDVEAVPQALAIAEQTNQIAWQNVVFALAVKAIVMVLGLLGHASMWLAVFADSGVAMLCVLNSIRLLYQKK